MASNIKYSSLKRSSDFQKLKINGKKFKPCYWLIINYSNNTDLIFNVGYTVSRQVGNAVVRNKLKRWSREFFRKALTKENLNFGMDINVIFRPSKDDFYKKIAHEELDFQLSKFFKHIAVKNTRKIDEAP